MARKLKNVTVTLDEATARWARIEAAKSDTSVSRFIGEMLAERMSEARQYEAAKARYLSQRPGLHRQDGRELPTRDELYERDSLR